MGIVALDDLNAIPAARLTTVKIIPGIKCPCDPDNTPHINKKLPAKLTPEDSHPIPDQNKEFIATVL